MKVMLSKTLNNKKVAKKRIFVDREGNAMVLLDDKIETITDFGDRVINRASTVEFHNEWNCWLVRMPEYDGQAQEDWVIVDRRQTRKDALDTEKIILEERFKQHLKDGKVFVPCHSRRPLRMEAIQHA